MKRILLSLSLLMGFGVYAQLPLGSFSSNFTVSAYQPWLSTAGLTSNGVYTLSDYLDRGYTVILDVSATWCGPCYNYHRSHILDQLYENYGPAGFPGVSPTTEDKVMVFWIDSDASTSDATLLSGRNTGNWMNTSTPVGTMPAAGTVGNVMFPMANPVAAIANQISQDFEIGYFPTIYQICPNRSIREIGLNSLQTLIAELGYCGNKQISPDPNVAVTKITSAEIVCDMVSYEPKAKLFNASSSPTTSVVVSFKQGGTVLSTVDYTTPIPAFSFVEVAAPVIPVLNSGTLSVEAVIANDTDPTNNSTAISIVPPTVNTTNTAVVKIKTDNYGSETGWFFHDVTNSRRLRTNNFGTYANGTSTVQPPVSFTLEANTCYEFYIADIEGDGLCCNYGQGNFTIEDGDGQVIVPFTNFRSSYTVRIKTSVNASIESVTKLPISVYPNPARDVVNISVDTEGESQELMMIDIQGRIVYSTLLSGEENEQKVSVSTENMAPGTYIIKILSNKGTATQKVIVK